MKREQQAHSKFLSRASHAMVEVVLSSLGSGLAKGDRNTLKSGLSDKCARTLLGNGYHPFPMLPQLLILLRPPPIFWLPGANLKNSQRLRHRILFIAVENFSPSPFIFSRGVRIYFPLPCFQRSTLLLSALCCTLLPAATQVK